MFGVIMMVKVILLPLFLLLTSLTGVCLQRPSETNVKAGEIVALCCRCDRGSNPGDAKVMWTSYTTQEMDLTNMSPAEQRQMGVLVHGRSFVILSASVNQQGNYSCSLGNASHQFWFRLMVGSTQTESKERTQYPQTCNIGEACRLCCPKVNIPVSIPDITSNGIIWHKEGESLQKDGYFLSVEENDSGNYTCTRSYLYHDQKYNMTFTVPLILKPKEESQKKPEISSPHNNDTIYVDLGSPKVIICKAVMVSQFDEVFWISGKSVVETNNNFPVFYNTTWENNAGEIKMTASLVFKTVSEEDLSKTYTCKLQSVEHSSSVTINLAQKRVCLQRPSETNVTAGEMVALRCPLDRGSNPGDAKVMWTSYTTQEMDLTNMSPAEQRQMGVLVHGRSFVILSASVNQQGNYSCSLGNAGPQFWFRLMVGSTQTESKERTQYPQTCNIGEACRLCCPEVNIPVSIPDITSKGIIWHKEGESLQKDGYFSSVEKNDSGNYTCTRSYLYHDQKYNMTFTVPLILKPQEESQKKPEISSPHNNDTIYVDLGSPKVIICKAVMVSQFDEVFWISGKSVVETNNSFPVFYNTTWENNAGEIKMTASLVFKTVSEEDLSKTYTCKLQSVEHSSSVTINLAQKRVCLQRPSETNVTTGETNVTAGEMVALRCPLDRGYNPGDAKVMWTSYTTQEMDLTNMSPAEQRQMGVLVHGRSFVILSASVNQQGNYSCSLGNASHQFCFRLMVGSTQTESKERTQYPQTCNIGEACRLCCPEVNIPVSIPNITSKGIIWHKEGESLQKDGYFSSVEENDSGNYTCTRSYLYDDQKYNMTFTVPLILKPKEQSQKKTEISSPHNNDTIYVDLARPSYVSLALRSVCILVVMVLTVVIYVKFKINITLFLRDTLGCHSSTSDGKSYDAFLLCYKSDTDAGLNEHDRKWLEGVLEERFGYSLCLFDRDVLPGKAVAEAVLDCVEESRTVVLVPTSPDTGPGSGLLSAIHAALVERQTRLVFIQTESTEMSRSGSLPEALQLLGEAGDCVTWKGIRSMPPSSSFWKQLRYYLAAPQHAQKTRLLPQTIYDVTS